MAQHFYLLSQIYVIGVPYMIKSFIGLPLTMILNFISLLIMDFNQFNILIPFISTFLLFALILLLYLFKDKKYFSILSKALALIGCLVVSLTPYIGHLLFDTQLDTKFYIAVFIVAILTIKLYKELITFSEGIHKK